jgi:hypothetical protein
MKKSTIIMTALSVLLFASCESDRDSNPVLGLPSSFVLNLPAYASTAVYDLKNTETVELTTTQPDYGFTAATTYSVQVSVSGQFTESTSDIPNYVTLPSSYSTAKMQVSASEIAVALVSLLGVTDEADYPKDPMPLYIRLKASLADHKASDVFSNAIELPKVLGYFALEPLLLPEVMYIVGSINDWDWTKSFEMVATHSNPGKLWSVQYFPAGAEIKFNTNKAWDGGEFGYAEGRFPDASVAYAQIEDAGGNIKINRAGWYIVVVTTEMEGRDFKYTVEFLAPNVYLIGETVGGWDILDANLFSVPSDGTGEFVSPAFGASNELRMCIKLDGIDWWKSEFIILGGKIVYRATGDDQERVSVSQGQKAYLNFLTGSGYVK